MDNRFTLKDFIFVVLFVVVIGAVAWTAFQFSYQERRLNDVKTQLSRLDARNSNYPYSLTSGIS